MKGGDFLVTSAITLGRLTKFSHMFIGATFVTIATSVPELIVSVVAVVGGSYGIAVGNIIGGMTANIALVLAISMIFLPSSSVSKGEAVAKSLFMLCAFVLVFIFSLDLRITWVEGLVLMIFFAVFVVFSVLQARLHIKGGRFCGKNLGAVGGVRGKCINMVCAMRNKVQNSTSYGQASDESSLSKAERKKLWRELLVGFLIGQVLIVVGAFVLVSNAERLSGIMGISETVVGLTFMAFGAAAPELTTVIASIRKKSGDMALGNILGSNIINSTLLLGLLVATSYAVRGSLPIARIAVILGIPLLVGVSLVAVLPMVLKGKTYRWQGLALVMTYVVYIIVLAALGKS